MCGVSLGRIRTCISHQIPRSPGSISSHPVQRKYTKALLENCVGLEKFPQIIAVSRWEVSNHNTDIVGIGEPQTVGKPVPGLLQWVLVVLHAYWVRKARSPQLRCPNGGQ